MAKGVEKDYTRLAYGMRTRSKLESCLTRVGKETKRKGWEKFVTQHPSS